MIPALESIGSRKLCASAVNPITGAAQHVEFVALAPDGNTLATFNLRYAGDRGEGTVRLLDIPTKDQVLTLPCRSRVLVMAFSPDCQRLFTGFTDGSSIIWDVKRGQRGASRE
jgi:WD40 repeat protein